MTTLLKRLSTRLGESTESPTGRSMPSSSSFNDFSLHAHDFVDEHRAPMSAASAAPSSRVKPSSHDFAGVVGSAPAGNGGFSSLAKSMALRIPRSSVAHLLEQRLRTNGAPGSEATTPRSSLDVPASAPTPRSALESPRSPMALASAGPMEEPASPRSPRTPGGRRRKSGKIDGMDYYEFCELIRSSSL